MGVRVAPYVPTVRWACAHFSQAAEASVVRCSVYGRVWALRRMGVFFRRLTSYPLANFFGVPFIFGSRLFAGVLGPPNYFAVGWNSFVALTGTRTCAQLHP